jgi:hypothetical protein
VDELEDQDDGQGPRRRDSHLRLELSIAIQYQRRRSAVADRWEARVSTVGLLIAGGIAALLLLWLVVPRVLDALGLL